MCFASTYDVIKGMDGEHLISCQFHFSVFHNIWSMDIPTCQTSGPLFWSPRVDLVLKVKWHIRLYSCTFRQTCISLPSLLKKTCSCSYMRHIYNYTYIWCISSQVIAWLAKSSLLLLSGSNCAHLKCRNVPPWSAMFMQLCNLLGSMFELPLRIQHLNWLQCTALTECLFIMLHPAQDTKWYKLSDNQYLWNYRTY